jgi:hypothetical protein
MESIGNFSFVLACSRQPILTVRLLNASKMVIHHSLKMQEIYMECCKKIEVDTLAGDVNCVLQCHQATDIDYHHYQPTENRDLLLMKGVRRKVCAEH